jgi:hypothetical protein
VESPSVLDAGAKLVVVETNVSILWVLLCTLEVDVSLSVQTTQCFFRCFEHGALCGKFLKALFFQYSTALKNGKAERGFGATARSTVRLTNPYREDRAHRAWHFIAHICSADSYL